MARAQSSPAKTDAHAAKVDELITNASTSMQPILRYLRDLIHETVPDAAEEVKWGRPFFTVNGTIVCYIAAFKNHCSLGFWSLEMTAVLQSDGVDGTSGSGSVGKITKMNDLPPRAAIVRYVREAAHRARAGVAASPMKPRPRTSAKASIPVPADFADALAKSKLAGTTFEAFPPSCRREYLQWITSAKRPETRDRRIIQAVTMLETGKRFNEKYRTT